MRAAFRFQFQLVACYYKYAFLGWNFIHFSLNPSTPFEPSGMIPSHEEKSMLAEWLCRLAVFFFVEIC